MSNLQFHSTCLLFALLVLTGCSQTDSEPTQESTPSPVNEASLKLDDIGPPEFVGSTTCQTCHTDEYADWMGSHHELAMQEATPDTVLGDFNNVQIDYFDETPRFFRRDGEFYVKTNDQVGIEQEYRIAYTFGVEPLQQYLIEFPGGRLQTLAFSWDTRTVEQGGQRWFHQFPNEYIAPEDSLHWTGPQQNWNYMCAECHSTDLAMNYDAASDSFNTTFSEISVGCEACHGPGSLHQNAIESGLDYDYAALAKLDDRAGAAWIMNTETGIAERSQPHLQPQMQVESCGRCHSRRGILSHEYEYGQPLTNSHMPALLDEGLYHADGQIQDEVFVYGSFLQSKMYAAGVSCTDCHNPHTSELITGDNANNVCAQCHMPTKFSSIDHAGHLPAQASCVDCHMAAETYMVVDDRRDHSFRIPRPDLTATIGTPNACSDCHQDQSPDWASAAIAEWRGPEAPPLADHFGQALHASRHGFANTQLLDLILSDEYPGIVQATAITQLAQPFGTPEFETIQRKLNDPDPLIRIAALRQQRGLPNELRLRLSGSKLLGDPVRGVRIEAASVFADMRDQLPQRSARLWPQAEQDLRASFESIANRPEALIALSGFEIAMQNFTAAQTLLETALRIEPRAVTARINLAEMKRSLGDDSASEKLLREGLEIDTDSAPLHHALGLAMVRSGQRDLALSALQEAANLAPDNPRFSYVYGIALNSYGQPTEGLAALEAAYQQFDGNFEIAMGLATLLRDQSKTDEALDIAYTLARRHPENQAVIGLLQSLGAIPSS